MVKKEEVQRLFSCEPFYQTCLDTIAVAHVI